MRLLSLLAFLLAALLPRAAGYELSLDEGKSGREASRQKIVERRRIAKRQEGVALNFL